MGRIVLTILFPAGVVLGACAEWAAEAAPRRSWAAVAVAVAAVGAVAADHWLMPMSNAAAWAEPMRTPLEGVLRRQEFLREAIRRHPAPRLVFSFPSHEPGHPGGIVGIQCDAMRASQDAGIPCVNGWSGHMPEGWYFFPDYRSMLGWLDRAGAPPEVIAGLVVAGEPSPFSEPEFERAMRARFPPAAPDR